MCLRIASLREADAQFEKLYIRKDSSSSDCVDQLFLDNAVYTRNRCFRLALSSKAGKNAFLLPTGRFRCKNLVCYTTHSLCGLLFDFLLKSPMRES